MKSYSIANGNRNRNINMDTHFANDMLEFFDAVDTIDNERINQVTIILTNDVSHCHKLRFLNDRQTSVSGTNKSIYNIYLDPRPVSDNPLWKFNSTAFFFSGNHRFSFSNLHFTYSFYEYDFYSLIVNFNEESNQKTKKIDYCDGQILVAYGILLMEFNNSNINFKDCILENNTNRSFEIVAKAQSQITFKDCTFKGDFNFIFDIDSRIIID